MRRSYFDYFEETVPANSKIPVNAFGRFLLIKESTDQLYCSIDSGKAFPIEVGLAFDLEQLFNAQGQEVEKDEFSKLTLHNRTNADVDVSFYVGRGKISDYRLNALVTRQITVNVAEAPTRTTGAVNALAAGGSDTYAGTDGGDQRKHILFANSDTDITLDVYDQNGVHCGFIFPQETLPIATSGKLTVKNNGSSAVTYSALELYYEF